jgi:hypothetical protein
MLGLKRVLFPASSPELSLQLVTQRGQKRQRVGTTHQGQPSNTHQCPKKHSATNRGTGFAGGILACVSTQFANTTLRDDRPPKRRGTKRTAKSVGSVLMNLESIDGNKNITKLDQRGASILELRERTISMDSLAGVVSTTIESVPSPCKAAKRKVSNTIVPIAQRKLPNKKQIKTKGRYLRLESNVDSLVSCSAVQVLPTPINSSSSQGPILREDSSKPTKLPVIESLGNIKRTASIQMTKKPSQDRKKPSQQENAQSSPLGAEGYAQVPITCSAPDPPDDNAHKNMFDDLQHGLVSPCGSHICKAEEECQALETPVPNEISIEQRSDEAPPVTEISIPIAAASPEEQATESLETRKAIDSGTQLPQDEISVRHFESGHRSLERCSIPLQPITTDMNLSLGETSTSKQTCEDQILSQKRIDNDMVTCAAPPTNCEEENITEVPRRRRSLRLSNQNLVTAENNTSKTVRIRAKSSNRKKKKSQDGPRNQNNENHDGIQACNPRRSSRQRCKPLCPGNTSESQERSSRLSSKFPVGTQVRKEFDSQGWFEGVVVSIDEDNALYRIKYEDGDVEDVDEEELEVLVLQYDDGSRGMELAGQSSNRYSSVNTTDVREKEHMEENENIQGEAPTAEFEEDDLFNATPMKQPFVAHPSGNDSSKETKGVPVIDRKEDAPIDEEDDIFNATPVQHLVDGTATNDIPKDRNDSLRVNEAKEFKRERKPPQRFGVYEHDFDGCTASFNASTQQSAMKKTIRKTGRQTMKRVRISCEGSHAAKFNDAETDMNGQPWTAFELRTLLITHKEVDPKSATFWERISSLVGTKTSDECMEKWFSLAKTPTQKKQTSRKTTTSRVPFDGSQMLISDDDIFNATPMRGIFETGKAFGDESAFVIGQLEKISKMADGSAIKLSKPEDISEHTSDEGDAALCRYPQGYKTYIQQMGRSIRQKEKRGKKGGKPLHSSLDNYKHLKERSDNGDFEMNCRLSPGGTLRLNGTLDDDCDGVPDYYEDEEDGECLDSCL